MAIASLLYSSKLHQTLYQCSTWRLICFEGHNVNRLYCDKTHTGLDLLTVATFLEKILKSFRFKYGPFCLGTTSKSLSGLLSVVVVTTIRSVQFHQIISDQITVTGVVWYSVVCRCNILSSRPRDSCNADHSQTRENYAILQFYCIYLVHRMFSEIHHSQHNTFFIIICIQ